MSTPTLLDSRYELGIRIGRGGMAEVFRAWDRRLSREVAVKLLNPECSRDAGMLERFRQESHALAQLNHPNIVTLFDTGETADGRFYLVMERLRGQPFDGLLRDLREQGEVLAWRQLVVLLRPICAALMAAHARQIVHRDIKPSNLFLHRHGGDEVDTGLIKILDFGIAKMLAGSERRPGAPLQTLTSSGLFIGTPHYSSPEAIEPDIFGPIGVGADIYALGVVMYHCLTGMLPFEGEPRASVIYKTAFADPPPLRVRAPERSIAPAVEAVVLRALARRPQDRFSSVRELLEAISSVPEDPTAPRAIVAARTVTGQIDSTTQVLEPQEKRSAGASGLLQRPEPARLLRRSAPEFRPSALHTVAEPAEKARRPAAGGRVPSGSIKMAPPPTPVADHAPSLAPQAAIAAVSPPLPATAWDVPPWLRASTMVPGLPDVIPTPAREGPPALIAALRAEEARPQVETQPELRALRGKEPSTQATAGIHSPLELSETPVPREAVVNTEPVAPVSSRAMLLVTLVLLAVIGAAWWFMPEAPPPIEDRR